MRYVDWIVVPKKKFFFGFFMDTQQTKESLYARIGLNQVDSHPQRVEAEDVCCFCGRFNKCELDGAD